MGRKSIQGYPEKSYYDNQIFKQMVATTDPLTEGSFAMLANLDISDTGRSVRPRKGFLTTTFKVGEIPVVLSNKVVYFKDNKTLKYIVFDMGNMSNGAHLVDISAYNTDGNFIAGAEKIHNYDVDDIKTIFSDEWTASSSDTIEFLKLVFSKCTILGSPELKPIIDEMGITTYVVKVKYFHNAENQFKIALKLYYNSTDKKLIVSYVNTDNQTTSLNPSLRNLASPKSLIPDPIRVIETDYEASSNATDVLGKPILMRVDDKYLTTQIPAQMRNALDKIHIEPTFFLQPASEIVNPDTGESKWAFRWDIANMSNGVMGTSIYRTPWYDLDTLSGDNPVISALNPDDANAKTQEIQYIVVSRTGRSVSKGESVDLTNDKTAASALFREMIDNSVLPVGATSLGTVENAYDLDRTIRKLLEDVQKGAQEDIDAAVKYFKSQNLAFLRVDTISGTGTDSATISVQIKNVSEITSTASSVTGIPIVTNLNCPYVRLLNVSATTSSQLQLLDLDEVINHLKGYKEEVKATFISMPYSYIHYNTAPGVYNLVLASYNFIFTEGVNAQYGELDESPTKKNRLPNYASSVDTNALNRYVFYNLVNRRHEVLKNFETNTIENIFETERIPRSIINEGLALILYLRPYTTKSLEAMEDYSNAQRELASISWDASAYMQSGQYLWQFDNLTYINEYNLEDAERIRSAEQFTIFRDRMVTWQHNVVYVSEEGSYYHYLPSMKKEFPEEVLKVVPFKNILLVFTVQHLYAIFEQEFEKSVMNDEGKATTEKYYEWVQQNVLYNINPSRRYLDVIQVFNQMILFYSSEGQLYMIRPSTMIDSETQFGIQYFNKHANDIFANYDHYINQRLLQYNKIRTEDYSDFITKDDVKVSAIVDIDKITIIYSVPNKITMFLIYDVVNNRYVVYDTTNFTHVISATHIDNGALYLTVDNQQSYLTIPYLGTNNVDENVDRNYKERFLKRPIFALLDTGNLDLNNHLFKRFRNLYITLKNLDASHIMYNAETIIDDVVVKNFYEPSARLRMSNGPDVTLTVDKATTKELDEVFGLIQTFGVGGSREGIESNKLYREDFYEDNRLLKVETVNSNKLIEYNSSILGAGKTLRVRLQFISKGNYKLQSFGIVYKERRL